MPKLTHPWHQDHKDEQEDYFTPNLQTSSTKATKISRRTFQDEACNETSKEARKAMVIERDQVTISKLRGQEPSRATGA